MVESGEYHKSWVLEALVKPPQYEPDSVRQGRERTAAGVERAQRALAAGELRQAFEQAKAAVGEAEQAERLVTELRQVEASTRDDDSSPGRPSLGSSSGRSGFGKSGSRRKKR